MEANNKLIIRAIIGGLALVAFLALNPFVVVDAGHRGVVKNFGAVQPEVLNEGLHFRIPFMQIIEEMNVRIQKAETDASSASRDLQSVKTIIALNFHVIPEKAAMVYQEVGHGYKGTIIDPAIQEVVKSATANYSAEELITKRSEVALKIKEQLIKRLTKYHIIVDDFSIRVFKFSEEFNRAIEEKQKAEQNALTQKNRLEEVKYRAQQEVEKAKAEAAALRAKRQQLSSQVLELKRLEVQVEAIKKWNGTVPQYMTGNEAPFLGKILSPKK